MTTTNTSRPASGNDFENWSTDQVRAELDHVQRRLENKLRSGLTQTEIAKFSLRRTRLEQVLMVRAGTMPEPMRQQPEQQHQAATIAPTPTGDRPMFDLTLQPVDGRLEIGLADPRPELTDQPAEKRVCATCDQPVWQTGDGFADWTHADVARDNDHEAAVKLAHPMNSDPFAGCDDADDVFASDREADAVAGILAGLAAFEQPAEPTFPTAEPEQSISLATFQQRVAAGEWSSKTPAAQPEFFVAPGGYGDPTLWRRTSNPDRPEEIVTKHSLDREHPLLWPGVVAHFTGQPTGTHSEVH